MNLTPSPRVKQTEQPRPAPAVQDTGTQANAPQTASARSIAPQSVQNRNWPASGASDAGGGSSPLATPVSGISLAPSSNLPQQHSPTARTRRALQREKSVSPKTHRGITARERKVSPPVSKSASATETGNVSNRSSRAYEELRQQYTNARRAIQCASTCENAKHLAEISFSKPSLDPLTILSVELKEGKDLTLKDGNQQLRQMLKLHAGGRVEISEPELRAFLARHDVQALKDSVVTVARTLEMAVCMVESAISNSETSQSPSDALLNDFEQKRLTMHQSAEWELSKLQKMYKEHQGQLTSVERQAYVTGEQRINKLFQRLLPSSPTRGNQQSDTSTPQIATTTSTTFTTTATNTVTASTSPGSSPQSSNTSGRLREATASNGKPAPRSILVKEKEKATKSTKSATIDEGLEGQFIVDNGDWSSQKRASTNRIDLHAVRPLREEDSDQDTDQEKRLRLITAQNTDTNKFIPDTDPNTADS